MAASAWGGGPHFANHNRGKQSVALDVKDPVHLRALKALIGSADIFVTNVRSGALDRAQLMLRSVTVVIGWTAVLSNSIYGLFAPRFLGFRQPQLSATYSHFGGAELF